MSDVRAAQTAICGAVRLRGGSPTASPGASIRENCDSEEEEEEGIFGGMTVPARMRWPGHHGPWAVLAACSALT